MGKEKYTPMTFIKNVLYYDSLSKGFHEAWASDKKLTAERNPNLNRFHQGGKALVGKLADKMVNVQNRGLLENPQTPTDYLSAYVAFGPGVLASPLAYIVGGINGSIVKPVQNILDGLGHLGRLK